MKPLYLIKRKKYCIFNESALTLIQSTIRNVCYSGQEELITIFLSHPGTFIAAEAAYSGSQVTGDR